MIQSIEIGRQQDGNRSIADKIIKRLHDIEKTAEYNLGRWAWELLQNAKDSIADDERKVNVEIAYNENFVTFTHDGNHFSEQDIRGLINQISSKEVGFGEKSNRVGRFGTGFITTHLLSKNVEVNGIVETVNKDFFSFRFHMDREGDKTDMLAPKIEETWRNFHHSVQKLVGFDRNLCSTSFKYPLNSEKQRLIAKKGIQEFENLMPFVLSFIPKIGKVTIKRGLSTEVFERSEPLLDGFIVQITKSVGFSKENFYIALSKNESVAVAIEIDPKTRAVKPLTNIPRIFCDFPLIGTEKFFFPTILNSSHFVPLTERDGIWLKNSEDAEVKNNQALVAEAVTLYKDLLLKLSENNVRNLYHAVCTKMPETDERYFDQDWYKQTVQTPLREFIIKTPIVDTTNHGRSPMIKENGGFVDFPYQSTKKLRSQIWELGNKLDKSTLILPEQESVEYWYEVIWDHRLYLDLKQFASFMSRWFSNIEHLNEIFPDATKESLFEWLNEFYTLIIEADQQDLFDQFAIVPNQKLQFCKVNEKQFNNIKNLMYWDEINDDVLVDILEKLGNHWRNILIHKKITKQITTAKLEKTNIAYHITKAFNELNGEWSDQVKNAMIILSEWFEHHPSEGKELFSELYGKRAELFMKTISDKESLYRVMKSNVPLSTLSEVAAAIENDPEILEIIERRKREFLQEKERNEIGEYVEQLLAEALKDASIQVEKVTTGKDLVLSIQGRFTHSVEVKSTRRAGFVAMTPTQAETAISNPSNYSLCVVKKDSNVSLTKNYVKQNARFVMNIGFLLNQKVKDVDSFFASQGEVSAESEGIGLLFENSILYKYKISPLVWEQKSVDFEGFVNMIKRNLNIIYL